MVDGYILLLLWIIIGKLSLLEKVFDYILQQQ